MASAEIDSRNPTGLAINDTNVVANNSAIEVKALQGVFYGTDFNFLYSEEMQRALATNCLSANWDSLMNFSQH